MIVWWVACVEGPGEPVGLPVADRAGFVAEVEPILGVSCANPSCHGDASRPLEVFAEHAHRLDPEWLHRDLPLTEEEHARNFARARSFLVGVADPDACALLYEPLAPSAGGAGHGDAIIVWEDTTDPDYGVLRAWIATALEEAP